MTFFEFNQKFPTEQAAIEYFYKIRYDGILACPHCESKVNLYRTVRQKVYICHFCENTFSPFVGIIFRKSTTDLRKWFYAIHLVLNAKRAFLPVIFSVKSEPSIGQRGVQYPERHDEIRTLDRKALNRPVQRRKRNSYKQY